MAPYNYKAVSIIYGFSLPQSPEAFTQTHIYFMALHEITKNTYTFGEVSNLAEIVLLLFSKQPTIRLDSKEPAACCDQGLCRL